MSDEDADTAAADEADIDAEAEDPVWRRDTAPQTPYTMRQVGIGFLVAIVAAVVAFGVPLLLG